MVRNSVCLSCNLTLLMHSEGQKSLYCSKMYLGPFPVPSPLFTAHHFNYHCPHRGNQIMWVKKVIISDKPKVSFLCNHVLLCFCVCVCVYVKMCFGLWEVLNDWDDYVAEVGERGQSGQDSSDNAVWALSILMLYLPSPPPSTDLKATV